MTDFFMANYALIFSIMAAVMATVAALLGFTQLRRTFYESETNRVRLDHSRMILEREIDRLHEQIYRDGDRLKELNHLLIDSIRGREPGQSGEHLDFGLGATSFLKSMGIDPSGVAIDPNFVFVLTPLNSRQLELYETIKDECGKVGLTVRRGDEKRIDGPILPHILREISSARLVVANINGRNPNVFYELGIAQAMGKPVILVVKSYDDVPFDLKQQQLVIYDDIVDLRDGFRDALSRYALG